MANRYNQQFFWSPHNKPTLLDCSFTVAAGDASGSGITGLNKSGRIANVFMNSSASFAGDTHTNTTIDGISSTAGLQVGMLLSGSGIQDGTRITSITSATAIKVSPATTATASAVSITYAAVGSPNPAAGLLYVQLQDNYNRYLDSFANFLSPLSGSDLGVTSGLTPGVVYVITALGTTTTANWQTLGVPTGTAPAVGVAFMALVAGAGAGNGTVKAVGVSGVSGLEMIGNPNLQIQSTSAAILGGGGVSCPYLVYQFVGASALGNHTHDLLIKGGQAASTTNDVAVYAGPILGKEAATDSTILGANSATNGGVVAASAGTMAFAKATPAAGTGIYLGMYFNDSAQGV